MAGTISRGIKAPIIREGDDIVKIVADSVLAAVEQDGFQLHERCNLCNRGSCCSCRWQLRIHRGYCGRRKSKAGR